MKKISIRSLFSIFGLACLSLVFAFISCEIGLGSAVDTQAPVVNFAETTIGSGGVIRDSFMIYGDWTDDGSIKEVTAKLTRTDGTKISFENAGTVVTLEAGKGTWNAVFDPIKEKIPDGSYEISVSMLDNGKHISTITRAIVIDNTAPLVVLSRPSTKKDSGKFDSYGQSFTLEGKAADDNDVSLIEVNVYADESCTGTPLKTIQRPNVPLTIEQDVAVYDKTKANDYSIIYGHVDAEGIAIKDGTTSQRYCTLVVYDGAQRYPSDGSEQTEADKKGNSVNYYYLNSDVSKLFTAGYKITELYHILNGSYEQGTASRSISSSDVNTLLADPSKQTTCGQFSINPENSPSYVVSSRNVLPEGHKFDEYPITNGNSQLEVEIAPGLDGHLIVENTVGIYLVRCDLTGNPLTTNGTPAASEAEAKKVWLVETDKHEEQAIVTQSGSTYKFKTKKNIGNDDTSGYPQLVIGENYYIAVVGKDEQGNDIVCDGLYGFQLITSGKNIEVGIKAEPEWLSTEDAANEENKKVKITLTYQTENKPFEIYRKFGQDITSTDTPITTGVNDSPYEDNIPAADLASEPGFVNYKIKGKESAESNQKTIEFKYDDDAPSAPTFTTVPSVTATEQDDITFQGTAEDTASGSGIEKVWIQFEYKDSTGATKTTTAKEVDASYSGKKWIYQTSQKTDAKVKAAFATQGSKKIIVTAEDVVGLTKSSSQTFTYDTGKPTVSVTEGLPSIVGQVQTLSGTAGDTWGVKKIVITQTKKGSTDSISYKYWEEGENASTPTTSKAWSVSIPLKSTTESYTAIDSTSSGEYTYTVTVTDKAEKTTTSDSVTIKFTSAKPTITFTQPSGALALTNSDSTTPWQTTSNNITISGTASVSAAVSGASISKVEYKFDNDAWASAGQASWSITKTISDGSTAHNLYVKATDNAGNVSEEYHRFIKVDTSAPNLTAKYLKQDTGTLKDASGTVYVKSGTKIYLYGNYDDEHSGVQALTFKLGGTTITPTNPKYSTTAITSNTLPTDYSAYSADSSTTYKSWQAEFTFTSSGTLTVQGKNNANKETTTLSVVNVVYDNAAPVVKISSPAKNEKLKAAGLTISGTANDGTGSGLSSGTSDIIVYYTKSSSLGGVTTAPTSISSSTNHGDASSKWVKLGTTASDTNWSFTLSSVNDTITPDGANTALYFTASAKDIAGAGNVGYAVPVTVIVDRKKPVYDSSALTIGGKTHSEMTASTKPWFSTDTLVVKGKYTDDGTTGSGVNTIIYKLDSNSEVELPTTDGTFNTNISGFTANSTLKIKAKDKAGNETDWTTYTVQADTSTTTLTVDTYKAGNDSEQTAAGTVYVKSGTQITLTGQYKNTVSGVKPLELKLGDTNLTVKYSTNGTSYGTYSASSAKAYTKWQAQFTPSAGGTITINGKNNADVTVTASSFQLTVDGEDPTLENLKLKETTGSGDDAVTKEAYLNETTETYYINNTVTTKSFKLTGVTTDDYGVEKVSFTVVNTAVSTKKLTISDISKPSGAWEKDITGWSSWNDGATLTITATDKAGRSTPKTINIVFDTTAPKAMHWADKKNKDVYFRIGNADNDKKDTGTAWETGDALNDANNAANQDVGSKYSFGSWGNDSSIEIRGAFYEATAGSGIKAIHYAIFDDESKVAAGTTALVAGTLKENTENHVIKVGSFSVQNEVTKRVPYTNTSGTKEGKTVKTNFRETLAGFDASNNFLVLVAEDNAGNREADTLKVYEGTGTPGNNSWNSSKAYYSIKKDSQTPNITTTTPNLYTNGAGEALSVTGTASDALSGLGSVTVTVEEIHFEQVIKNFAEGSASQNWTATISADKFAGINSGSYTVYAEAKDKAGAGNKKKISAGTIYVDKDAPVVTISSPVADSVTKKTFTISGTARDGNGAGIDETKDLVLYYTKKENPSAITGSTTFGSSVSDATTKWVPYSTKPTLDSTNHQDWDCEVDFSSIAADNNNTDVYLSVSATDKSGSGNTGYSAPRKVTVDRKKPVKSSFKIGSTAEADIADAWFNNTTLNINGAFADNGGSGVTEILYTLDSGSEISIPAGENGTFDSNIAGFTNGEHTLKVRAKDAADNESAYSSDTTYTIHVDNQASTLNCTTSGQQYTNGVNAITVSGTFVDSPATGCAGADTITLSVNNKTINATLTPTTQNDYSSGTWTATITTSSLGLTQGTTYSVNGTITDKAGNSSTATVFALSLDKKAPVVTISTPSTATKVNGLMTLTGKVDKAQGETSIGSEPVKLELYVSKVSPTGAITNTSTFTKIGTITDSSQIYTWTFADIDTYAKTGVASAPKTKTLYVIPVVTDSAGNTNVYDLATSSYKYTKNTNYFEYTVDMDSDRPTVKVTNLTNLGDDSNPDYILRYGENARIDGTVSDDDSSSTKVVKTFVATTSQITSVASVTSTTDSTTGIITSKLEVGSNTPKTYDITTINPATGDWTFTPADTSDGEKTVNFYIVDNYDAVFYTGKTVTVSGTDYDHYAPYFQFKTSDAISNTEEVSYKSDATSPRIQTTKVQAYKATTGADSDKIGTKDPVSASTVLGGTQKRYAKFEITAFDENDISEIRLTLNYKNTSGTAQSTKITSIASHDGFTNNGSKTGTSTYVWTTDSIDVSTWKTESVSGTVEAYDNSSLLGTASYTFFVDNTGPVVAVTSPSSTEELTGTQKFVGTSTDSGSAGTQTTEWLIPTITQAALSDTQLAALTTWNKNYYGTSTASSWEFELSSATLSDYDNATYAGTNINNGVYTLPFYVKATDSLGNYTIYKGKTFKHNPEADRPKTEITYPNDSNYTGSNNFVTLGGAIRITGSSIIPSATTTVGAVYLQVINGTGNSNNGSTYTKTKAFAQGKGYAVVDAATAASALGQSQLTFATGGDTASNWWGIKANNATSWNYTINDSSELNPEAGELTYIAIRACAINAEGKVGTWTDWYYLNIDDTAPTQNASLYQFNTNPTSNCVASTVLAASNIKASTAYENGMYLRGTWYLAIKIHDESELKALNNISTVKKGSDSQTQGSGYFASTVVTGSDGKEKTQYIFIPVSATSTYTVTVEDNEHAITQTYSLQIDNTAPEITAVYKGEDAEVTANHLSDSAENIISDSNYIYTLGGTIGEGESGFDRLAFYYVRANAIDGKTYSSEVILDPFITTGTSNAKAEISGLTARTFTQGNNSYTLYAKSVAGKLGADGYTFTPTTANDIKNNKFIRVGGLIEANGVLRRIESINASGVVTFDTDSCVTAQTSATVYFPYAQVVDNRAAEKTASSSANPFTFQNNSDDGDGMPEYLSGSISTGYNWTATMHSSNIADGPCALVVLAFDKAGNVSGKTYDIKIENSAPRLAKVFLGTDLNSSNTWEANEFVGYNLYNANEDYGIATTEVKPAQAISTANYGSAFTIKDKLAVVAEFVGGNGDITMVYGRGATTTAAVPSSGTGAGISATANDSIESLVTADKIGTVTYKNVATTTSLKGFTLANTQIVAAVTEANDGTGKTASFTFWDSTDELTAGVDSQNCVLLVNDFTIDLVDSIAPHVVVNPFYWADSTKNSLYGNSTLNGHIELEDDLTGTAAATSYGTDPKVSGKITFTGTAYDEHALKSLSFTLAGSNGTALTGFDNIAMANYDPTNAAYNANGGWSALSGNSGSALSAGGKYEWSISTTASDTSRYYEDTCYLGQEGHKIYWTISIDTAQIPNVAQTDVKLTVTATQLSTNTPVAATVTSTTPSKNKLDAKVNHVPTYQMDIVPYITKVYTGLAKNKKSNWSVYNRTALGHYPVQSVVSNIDNSIQMKTTTSEDIVLYGFNLNASSAKIVSGSNTFTVGNETDALKITSTPNDGTLTFNAAKLATGELNLTVNSIKAMNNINNNDAKGDASEQGTAYVNWYNRQGNGDTNNILTDNVEFDVWEFNDRAAVPINGLATGINMEVNQKTGMLNYAFANGGLYYSMGGNTNQRRSYSAADSYSSYYWAGDWDTFAGPCVGFHVDEQGYTYSVVSGGDTNKDGSVDKWDLYTSRWGRGKHGTAGTLDDGGATAGDGNFNALRLEEIGLKTGANATDYSLMKYRFLSPEFASTVDTTNDNTNLYLVYYDALCNQIRFRAGTFSGTTRQSTGGFQDQYTTGASSYYNTNNCQVIANGKDGATFKDGANTNVTVAGISGRGAGQYVDVAVVKNSSGKDVVCVVWFDAEDNCCKFSYITDPITNWANLTGNATAESWETPQTIFEEGGEYCHIVADKNNHLHIAAYAGNGDVKYAYLDIYSSTAETCTVDASGAVGEHLTLDVAVSSNGNSIPYIGYYTSAIKMPKYAYLVDKATGFDQTAAGVDDDERFTGAWEVTVVPSPNRMTTNREDKVNVGVWKNAGVLTDSKIAGNNNTRVVGTSSRGGTLNGYSSTNWSKTFGNGTSNGVLGYQISTATGSCLETAQMR